jgi:hypothetical protein
MIVAVPLLATFCIAAPVSTLETTTEESEVSSENARNQLPWTASFLLSKETSGAAPPDDVITPGFTNTRATNVGLMNAVRTVHARKLDEGFDFATAFREVSHELKKKTPGELRTLTPEAAAVEANRELAAEVKEHPDALEEEERILQANESSVQEDEGDDDHRGKKRITFFPRV